MQKTVGPNRLVESGRATAARSQRNNYGYHLSSANYDGKIAGLYDLEETLGKSLSVHCWYPDANRIGICDNGG